MARFLCAHCQSNNPEPGRCIVCGKRLGNLRKALLAGILSTLALSVFWILLSSLTGLQLPLVALFFGGMVSFCVTHFSGGRGIVYQLIATVLTVLGIVAADSIAMMVIGHIAGDFDLFSLSPTDFYEAFLYGLREDDFTAFFYVLGVMGGFYIWR